MIHLLNMLHITITIIKQTPNFLLQKITVWETKGNRQRLGVEKRAYKQHRWASKILLRSIAKSKHFKTMSQEPEKSWNVLTIHEWWKITYFSNACIIVQAHSLPNCLSVVLPQQFLHPLTNFIYVWQKSRELNGADSWWDPQVAGLGVKPMLVAVHRGQQG